MRGLCLVLVLCVAGCSDADTGNKGGDIGVGPVDGQGVDGPTSPEPEPEPSPSEIWCANDPDYRECYGDALHFCYEGQVEKYDCSSYEGNGFCLSAEEEKDTGCVARPDVVIISVSGHSFNGNDVDGDLWENSEYLEKRGTVDAVANVFEARGATVEKLFFSDNYYDAYAEGATKPHSLGFLSLLITMTIINKFYLCDPTVTDVCAHLEDQKQTRIIMLAHSHGTVWAHTALFYAEFENWHFPIDVLIDLDGESLGWKFPVAGVGDYWESEITNHGLDWPWPISNATNFWPIPGLADDQDVEDVVPESVLYNLEIASNDSILFQDGEPNHRLDGSGGINAEIYGMQFAESHKEVTQPYSQAMQWVMAMLNQIYFPTP